MPRLVDEHSQLSSCKTHATNRTLAFSALVEAMPEGEVYWASLWVHQMQQELAG